MVITIIIISSSSTTTTITNYSHGQHNEVSVNYGPHKRRWSRKILIQYYNMLKYYIIIPCWLTVCIVVVVLCVLSSYVYLLYYVCIADFYFRCWTAG